MNTELDINSTTWIMNDILIQRHDQWIKFHSYDINNELYTKFNDMRKTNKQFFTEVSLWILSTTSNNISD